MMSVLSLVLKPCRLTLWYRMCSLLHSMQFTLDTGVTSNLVRSSAAQLYGLPITLYFLLSVKGHRSTLEELQEKFDELDSCVQYRRTVTNRQVQLTDRKLRANRKCILRIVRSIPTASNADSPYGERIQILHPITTSTKCVTVRTIRTDRVVHMPSLHLIITSCHRIKNAAQL